VPVAVEAPTLIVRVDVAEPPAGGVTEAGLKVPVVPVGKPVIERLTAELKLFKDVIVMVEVPEPPGAIDRDEGEAPMEKSGAAVTVSDIVVLCVRAPLVPVTVRVTVPVGVAAPTLIVRVDVAEPPAGGVTEVGLKVPVAPVGKPVIERLTAELKLFRDVMVIVDVPELPCVIVSEFGEAEIEKSGLGVTVKLMLTLCFSVPLVPLTVSV